jgi:hypothetical protein
MFSVGTCVVVTDAHVQFVAVAWRGVGSDLGHRRWSGE